jgi:hypothetical protein
MMSTDFEQRLRSDMEAVVVRPRPGMAREAYRRYHDRRRTTRALASMGTAAVAVAGTAVGVTAASGTTANVPAASGTNANVPAASGTPTGMISVQTAAFVAHVSGALGAAGMLTHATSQDITPDGVAIADSYWAYGNTYRDTQTVWGKLTSGVEDTAANGKTTQISVDYTAQTWTRSEFPGGSVQNHVDLCSAKWFNGVPGEQDAADLKSMIQSGLRCGDLQVTGHQKVDGIDALALTVHFKFATPQTIWVDTKTYLPVLMVTHPDGSTSFPAAPGTGNGDVPVTEERTQYSFLAPTTANLAQLTIPVPPGFQQVSAQG